jgi:hypothetical protein
MKTKHVLYHVLYLVLSGWMLFQLSGCAALTGTGEVTNMLKSKLVKNAAGSMAKPVIDMAIVPGVDIEQLSGIKKLAVILKNNNGGNNGGGNHTDMNGRADIFADNLVIQMMLAGYDCIENRRLLLVLKENGIQWEDDLELENLLIRTAFALGAQAVITTAVQRSNDLIHNASLKLINAENSNPLMYLAINYKQPKYPHVAARNIANVLKSKLDSPFNNTAGGPNSEEKKISTKTHDTTSTSPAVSRPPIKADERKIDLSAIKKESYKEKLKRAETRKKWSDWQEKFQVEFDKIKEIDSATSVSLKSKKKAWKRFLDNYSRDNPGNGKERQLKQFAKARIKFWEEFSTPESLIIPAGKMIALRSRYKGLSPRDVKTMLYKYNFYSADWYVNKKYCNPGGSFDNRYVVGKKVIADVNTGLMWERFGSPAPLKYRSAKYWISLLNRNKYAGYKNWRLPTLDEAASLLKNKKNAHLLHVNVKFSKNQSWIWTGDYSVPRQNFSAVWVINFFMGIVEKSYSFKSRYVRAVRTIASAPGV